MLTVGIQVYLYCSMITNSVTYFKEMVLLYLLNIEQTFMLFQDTVFRSMLIQDAIKEPSPNYLPCLS